ncbi:uncharacterized protein LOC131529762 [Onychostoma macrolepis]|uniref:uncharacterized protein LOC131529762 n=1 Tax=Onychostoma macrolepis TaxID=369639 RepID=UPI00272BE22E|nr:uncharacterized protein LOC131529762 [Onychostoma macrolepis]
MLFSEMMKMYLKLIFFSLWSLVGFGVRSFRLFDEKKFVKIANSVTLNSGVTEMKDDDLIQWRFGNENTLIAEINKQGNSMTVYDGVLDGRFRDRLKLDNKTGSLTITNTTTEDTGVYELRSNRVGKLFLLIVYVEILTKEGESVTINSGLTEIMDNDVIQWRFGPEITLIAGINKQADRMTVYDDVLDGRFRDRLKLDKQTGSLTITNITIQHTGDYVLLMNHMIIQYFLTVYDEILVMKRDSVTLNSGLTEIMDEDEIQWRFGPEITLIAEINKRADSITVHDDVLDERFRDRLKLDKQTGSLTITNIRTEHTGRYVLLIFGSKPSLKAFSVSVYDSEHCCGSAEAVIRLVLSALVGVATVVLLVYDIRSRRAEQDQAHIHTSESIEI